MSDNYMIEVDVEFGVTKFKGMGLPAVHGPRCNMRISVESDTENLAHVKEGLMVLVDSWKMSIANLSEGGEETI